MFWQESKDKQFYSLQPQQPYRPDSFRSLERPSFKSPSFQQSRPTSSGYLQKNTVARPYSTSYDRRPDLNKQPQQVQSPANPQNRVQHQSQTDLRQSFKPQNLKSSLMINPQQQMLYQSQKPQQRNSSQQPQMRYCSSKSKRYFNIFKAEKMVQQSPIQMSEKRAQSTKSLNILHQSTRKNEVESQQKNSKQQEVQEYKKLQDKLSFLENKIQNIKSHIHSSNQQLIKNFKSDTKQKGLTAKFFSNQRKDEGKENKLSEGVALMKQSSNINHQNQQEQSQNTFPKTQNQALAQFITQVKPSTNPNKVSSQLSLGRDKQLSIVQGEQVKNTVKQSDQYSQSVKNQNKKSIFDIQNLQQIKKSSVCFNNRFQYYISSLIKAYQSNENSKHSELIREHLAQQIQGVAYAKQMKEASQSQIEERRVMLPKTSRKTIVFDLDETLIHCNENADVPGDVILPIRFPSGEMIEASINIRPYAQQILATLSKYYEIVIFTASHDCYANVVLDYLDPQKQWISYRLFRDSCVQTEEQAYVKDLRVIGNRRLQDMLLVDNAVYSFGYQLGNGVPILNFYDNKEDQELIHLQNYLMSFRGCHDMREMNRKWLKVERYADFQEPQQLLSELFRDLISQQ